MAKITPEQLGAASDAIGRELKRLEGLSAARDTLRDLGSLTAHALEVEKRITEVNRELAIARSAVAQAQDDLDRARRQAVDIGKAAAEECTRLRAEAHQAAGKTHADAVAGAQSIMEGADAEAKRVTNDALKFKQTVDQDVASAKLELSVTSRTVAERRAELETLNARLAEAHAAAAKVLADASTTTTKEPA